METNEKKYVGNGREIGNFGDISIGIRYSDLVPNEKGYINLVVSKMKNPNQYKQTHTVYVDTWKPTLKTSENVVTNNIVKGEENILF